MAKESIKNINKSCVFREPFLSFNEISKNGGTQTDVALNNGIATFDGSSSKIITKRMFFGEESSIRVRFKFNSKDTQQTVLETYNGSSTNAIFILLTDENNLRFFYGGTSASNGASSIVTEGVELDIVCVHKNNYTALYVNGDLKATASIPLNNISNNNNRPCYIGERYNGDFTLDGEMELLEIYDYGLSANEVAMLYNDELHTAISDNAGYGENKLLNYDLGTWVIIAGSPNTSDNNQIITGAVGGLANSIDTDNVFYTGGKHYLLKIAGTTTASDFKINDGYGAGGVLLGTYTGTFSDEIEFKATTLADNYGSFYLRHANAGITTLTQFEFYEITNSELIPIMEYDFVKNRSAYNKVPYGDNLVTNGHFDTGISGWSFQASSGSWYNNDVNNIGRINVSKIVTTTTLNSAIYQTSVITGNPDGKKYEISFDYYIPSDNSTLSRVSLSYFDPTTTQKYIEDEDLSLGSWHRFTTTIDNFKDSIFKIWVYASDSSGNRANLTVGDIFYIDNVSVKEVNNENTSLTDCTFGQQGLIANGSTTKLDTGSTADLTGDITVETIINPTSYGDIAGKILSNITTSVSIIGGTRKFLYLNSTSISSANNSILINDKPKHCIITRTSSGVTNFYIDSKLSGTADQASGTPVAGTGNIIIGNQSDSTRTFDGVIKNVNVYSGIATLKQIEKRYNKFISKGYLTR